MALVVDGPHTIWADVGGGAQWDVATIARLGAAALAYKISEGRGYIDAAGQYHHDQAVAHGLLPIPYVFPLPAACGMSIPDQAKRDADLIHSQHGSFDGIGLMLDLEYEPGVPGWGPFQLSSADARTYVTVIKQLTGLKVGGYTGAGYAYNGREGFDWRVVPNYSYGGARASAQGVDVILRVLNGGVTWMPLGGAWRQFTDAVNVSGRKTDFNIAPIPSSEFLAIVGGAQHTPNTTGDFTMDKDAKDAFAALNKRLDEMGAILVHGTADGKPDPTHYGLDELHADVNQLKADVAAIKAKVGG